MDWLTHWLTNTTSRAHGYASTARAKIHGLFQAEGFGPYSCPLMQFFSSNSCYSSGTSVTLTRKLAIFLAFVQLFRFFNFLLIICSKLLLICDDDVKSTGVIHTYSPTILCGTVQANYQPCPTIVHYTTLSYWITMNDALILTNYRWVSKWKRLDSALKNNFKSDISV